MYYLACEGNFCGDLKRQGTVCFVLSIIVSLCRRDRVEMVVAPCPEFHMHTLPGVALAMGINCFL